MWVLGLDSLEYGLLHDLRQVRSHYNRSNLIKTAGALSEGLLQWYYPANSQVIRNLGVVQRVANLLHDLGSELLLLVEEVAIEAVGSEALVEV